MDWKPIYSSHIDSIAHENGDLFVRWDNGKVSVYKNVPADVAASVSQSWSVGSALREQVKGVYDHEYLAGF